MIETNGTKPFTDENVYSFKYKYADTRIVKYLTKRMKRKITSATIVEYSKRELYESIVYGKV
jgi:hypothetical protein